jgi:sensor c-di-GMP phosphodiesterase-like protein
VTSRNVILLGAVLAALGAALPLAAAAYLAWQLALSGEQERLSALAERLIARTNMTIDDASQALETINATGLVPCSEPHIAEMRALTTTGSINEVGYFVDDLLQCTSWGITKTRVPIAPADFTTANGIAVTAPFQSSIVSDGRPVLGFQRGSYSVLVDPQRFIDVVDDTSSGLAIAHQNGTLISARNTPAPALLASLMANPRTGMDDDTIFAVAEQNGWLAIATSPRNTILASLQRQLLVLLPIGIAMAALIVGAIIWASRKRLSPASELARAVRNHEFVVHYQPLIELKSGICVGAEALVRWRRPDGSMVRPDLFIPLAEESGLILPITDQVIEAVIADLGATLVADRSLHVAINFCADDIRTGRMLPILEQKLRDARIKPQQIWLEATERGFIDIEAARVTMSRARAMGHSVAIDDFGTGYSSLQYLQDLPLDALKIDKSFIDTIGKGSATSSVTPHIISMAKTLGLFIVAEGIETQDQADYLIDQQVGFGQGWLYAKPLPAKAFITFHAQNQASNGVAPEVLRASS